jgi:peptidoglycan/LPS O-acetylase OafA/YrhL
MSEAKSRYHYLDGLRGIASIFVANFHFFCAFLPAATSEYSTSPLAISDTPVAVTYNGGFAVSIFFVLSGFVLANSAAKRHLPLWFNILQRYVRLAIPVLASTILAWLMLKLFPHTVGELKAQIPSKWLTFVYDRDIPSLGAAIGSGGAKVFASGNSYFNNVLWTMKIELLGSWLVYIVYKITKTRALVSVLCAIALAGIVIGRPEFSAFAIGALLRECVVARRLPTVMPWAALCMGAFLGAMMQGYDHRVIEGRLHLALPNILARHPNLTLGEPHKLFDLIGAMLVIYAFLTIPKLQAIFSHRSFRFLGEVSFGFYLVHVILIYTVIGKLYAETRIGLPGTYAVFLAVSLLGGYVFTIAVDRPVMRLIHRAQRRVAMYLAPVNTGLFGALRNSGYNPRSGLR